MAKEQKEKKKEIKKVTKTKKEKKAKEEVEQTIHTNIKKEIDKNIKVYNVLSYIGILWLVGLLGPDKDNSTVKFHVGQGILISILWFIVMVFNDLIIANLFRTSYVVWGVTYTSGISPFGHYIMGLVSLIPVVFTIIGIMNALNDKENELPIIGKYSFYK